MDHVCFIRYAASTMGMSHLENKLICMTVDSTYTALLRRHLKIQDLSFYLDMSAERKVKGNGIPSLQYIIIIIIIIYLVFQRSTKVDIELVNREQDTVQNE